MDLERLAGITVGYDFDAALASVELGFESTRATQYTNTGGVICVAKAMNVLREGRPMAHVVYNANFIEQLLDPENEHHNQAIHIIAHELGHVAELKWRVDGIPGMILQPYQGDWVSGILLDTATTIWEEYAACRQTAYFGDVNSQRKIYAASFDDSLPTVLGGVREKIKFYRNSDDLDRLLIEAGTVLAMPLKLSGYFLGHLDGIEDPSNLEELCPELPGTIYAAILPQIRSELRRLWSCRTSWKGIEEFDLLISFIQQIFKEAGIELRPQPEGGFYVHVPFTAETMPNGEADMLAITLERILKNGFGTQ